MNAIVSAEDRAKEFFEALFKCRTQNESQIACLRYADEVRMEVISQCIEICKHHYRALDAVEAIEKLSDRQPRG